MLLRRIAPAISAAVPVVIACLLAVITPACADTTTARPAAAGLLALRNGDITATDPGHYGVIVLNAWESGRIPAIKAANPAAKVLVYKDMSSTRSYAVRGGVDDAKLPTGVGYAFAERTHPEWFLTDTLGARVEWAGYPGHWWMDVANPTYMEAWAANVSAELAAGGWDGVMVDNTMSTPEFYLGGRTLARYPDAGTYAAATDRFLATVGPRLKASGFAVIPNLGGNFVDLTTYRRWVGYSSGALREHFGRWGSDGNGQILTDWAWSHQLEQQEIVQGLGRTFLAVPYAKTTDVAFQRYVRASFLLGWDGGSSSLLFTPPAAATDPYVAGWTTDVGTPIGPRTAVGPGWRRSFTAGTVVVNPSSTSSVTIPLGSAHLLPDGTSVTSVTLGPASGLVLRSAGAPTAAAPAAPAAWPVPQAQVEPGSVVAPSAPASAGAVGAAGNTAGAPSSSAGYLVLANDGEVYSYGSGRSLGSLPALGVRSNKAITLSSTPSGNGYWILGSDGGIFTFGDAQFFGSVPGLGIKGVNALDLQPTPSGNGYWILGSDGGVFTFGDAQYFGSVPGLGIRNTAAKIAPTRSGNGYWVLGADGGIFSFGDAEFFGSLPGVGVRNTSLALATTSTGRGYWILGADGGIFSFGDAGFHGSVPGLGISTPGIQFRPTRSGGGYYILSTRGDVFPFGDAVGVGSPAALGIRAQDLTVTG